MKRTAIPKASSPFSRRKFLATIGAGVAALVPPFIIPGNVLGANGAVAPSNRIAIGFVGTGRQTASANIPGFLHQADAQVVAVCDADRWRMEQCQEKVNAFYAEKKGSEKYVGCRAFADWRELVGHPEIDAIMIGTPDHWHVLMALAALRAGKDVSCEKPLTRSIAEGRLLADTVKQHNRVFCTDSEFRTYRIYHQAVELIRNGKIGKLERIITATPKDSTIPAQPEMPVPPELDYEMWKGPAPERPYTLQRVHPRHNLTGRPGWLLIQDYADGMLANWGAHLNDIAMWANDTERTGPVEVQARGTFPPEGNLWDVVQDFEAEFLFGNGVRLICQTESPYMRFEGNEGWIHLSYPPKIELHREELLTWKPGPQDIQLPRMQNEKREFLDAVKARRQPQYNAEGGHRTASLSHLALASMRLGRRFKWDPAKEEVVNDPTANALLQPKSMRPPWKLA